ncbi:MAG: hypothetical protein ABR81_05050 [Cryomorphaceae bacterium BACL11 MAG-121128-bin16]|jgi:hypothetical protein|nr:MAG: hypothetical protein ABR81_05050 [Cryomorphaceae bacterium BACL11 MAG-121128-bin16]
MLNRIFKTVLLGSLALVISTTFIACEKAKDTIGIIIVKDSNGNTVSGATVVLHQDGVISPQGNSSNPELRKTDVTDANGRAEFTYELEAIFQVDVEKIDGNNIYNGSNIIRLLKEKTVTQVVEIN